MKAVILTEGSKNIGFGHITRCTSLYQAFEEKDIRSFFLINGDETIKDLLRDKNYEIFNWIEDTKKLFISIKDADVAIIDSYLAHYDLYEKISNSVKIPVYIDDDKRIDYPKGIVVNGTIYAEKLDYPQKKDVIYLLGTQYTPIRKAFWNIPKKEIKETLESIMITFGGNDIRNLTSRVLRALVDIYPELTKNLVIGRGFRNIDR